MINREVARRASVSFKVYYQKTMQNGEIPPVVAEAIDAMLEMAPQDTDLVYRNWAEEVPKLLEWSSGDRPHVQIKLQEFATRMKRWGAGIEVPYEDLLFDRLGVYSKHVLNMRNEFVLHPYRQLALLIEDGWTGSLGSCWDGNYLFSSSHSSGSNAVTTAFSASALATGVAAMKAFVDPAGDLLNLQPTHIWYHPSLEGSVEDVLDLDLIGSEIVSDTAAATIRNKWYKKLKKLPLPLGSSYTAYWGLLAYDPIFKPGVYAYIPKEDKLEDDESLLYSQRKMRYGVSRYARVYPGFFQYIYGSTGAG